MVFVTSTWPHLRCNLSEGRGILNKNSLCVTVLCTIVMVHKGTSSSYRLGTVSGFDLAWFSSLFFKHLCISGLYGVIYDIKIL